MQDGREALDGPSGLGRRSGQIDERVTVVDRRIVIVEREVDCPVRGGDAKGDHLHVWAKNRPVADRSYGGSVRDPRVISDL